MSENEYNLASVEKKYKTWEEGLKAKQNNILKAQEARKQKAKERREKQIEQEDWPPEQSFPQVKIKDYLYYDSDEEDKPKRKKVDESTPLGNDLINLMKNLNDKIEYNIKKVDKLYYMKKNKIKGGSWKEEKPIIINNQLPSNWNENDSVYNAIRAKIIKQ